MATVLTVGIFIAIAVGAAELVRIQCRRMLAPPVRRPAPRPARAPRLASVPAPEAAAMGYATASAA
jgi:hypothetical protein